MEISQHHEGCEDEIAALFETTFSDSEGPEEGALIGRLAGELLRLTPDDDLFVFLAREDETLAGAIMFSRLSFDRDTRSAFVLGPVAVAPGRQGRGVGQTLLRHGLAALRSAGVDMALTYGDPAYYARVGFEPITESFASAPFPLRFPEGWLAQSLNAEEMTPLKGRCTCVAAFDDPAFW